MSAENAIRDWWFCHERTPGLTSKEAADRLTKFLDRAGYVIVPKEPSEAMLRAAVGDRPTGPVHSVWQDMLAAAALTPHTD